MLPVPLVKTAVRVVPVPWKMVDFPAVNEVMEGPLGPLEPPPQTSMRPRSRTLPSAANGGTKERKRTTRKERFIRMEAPAVEKRDCVEQTKT